MLDPRVPTSSACAFCNLRVFDVHEVAINFEFSAHQGDKRKTSQQSNLTLSSAKFVAKVTLNTFETYL